MKNKNFRFITFLALSLCICASQAFAQVNDAQFKTLIDKYLQTADGKKAIGNTVEEYFKARQEEARKAQEERAAGEVEDQFKNPTKVDIGSSPVKGPQDAKITIVEFSDFQCPYCTRGRDTMEQVLKAYPTDVKLAFKNLPLPFHKEAEPAARAALSAGKQGKFWEMHDELFANQKDLSSDFYTKAATKLGLNMEQFAKDMASPEIAKQVKDDAELGRTLGITGTPGFFVNGVAVKGAYPFEHFKTIIDRWLKDGAVAK